MVLITQRPHSARIQNQTRIIRNVLRDPPSRERTQDMPVRDNEDIVGFFHGAFRFANGVAVEAGPDIRYQGVEAGGDLGGRSELPPP